MNYDNDSDITGTSGTSPSPSTPLEADIFARDSSIMDGIAIRRRELADRIAIRRRELDEIEFKRQQITLVQTYQFLWNIREEDGPEVFDGVLKGRKSYDISTVLDIGQNQLLREERMVGRAPLSTGALRFFCQITNDPDGPYYAVAREHIESGMIGRHSDTNDIKRAIKYHVVNQKLPPLKHQMPVSELIQRLEPFSDDCDATFGQGKLIIKRGRSKIQSIPSNSERE